MTIETNPSRQHRHDYDRLFILAEMYIGKTCYFLKRSSKKVQILKAFEEMVFPNVNILPFDRQSGRVFGMLKAELEKRGIGCSEPDLRIAAVAVQHGLVLITGNTRHFKNIPGLRIEDWIT